MMTRPFIPIATAPAEETTVSANAGNDQRPKLIADADAKETGERFMGSPTRWLDNPHWRCPNGHVSTRYLKSELKGALCLACHEPLWLTFPEDKDDPAPAAPSTEQNEVELCIVCEGKEPCSHNFDKISWPSPTQGESQGSDEPGEEDGPWAEGWSERSSTEPTRITHPGAPTQETQNLRCVIADLKTEAKELRDQNTTLEREVKEAREERDRLQHYRNESTKIELALRADLDRVTKERDKAEQDFDRIVRKGTGGWYDDQYRAIQAQEAQIDALRELNRGHVAQLAESERKREEQVADLTKRLETAEQCLSDLMDYQNGPPLPKYEKRWTEVMERAEAIRSAALTTKEKP